MAFPTHADSTMEFGVSPRVTEVASLLSALRHATDAVSDAVRAHRHGDLVPAIAAASDLAARLRTAIEALELGDRVELTAAGVAELAAALDTAARRNALLIEKAWATDASLMRLLMSAGRPPADSFGSQYSQQQAPSYVDREA